MHAGHAAAKAPSAFGVCKSVITDAASHNRQGDRSNEQRTADGRRDDPPEDEPRPLERVTCAVLRAVAHTIAATGASGRTPSSWPAIDTGTPCTASHMLATAPSVPVRSLLATTNCTNVIAAMTISATKDGPNATPGQIPGCGASTVRRLST